MIRGSCLCGAVQFELTKAVGPFEICHCNRCRKTSGTAGMAALGVLSSDYRMTTGVEYIRVYTAPILYEAPAYEVCFCSICGSPTPPIDPPDDFFEIPAGLLDDDPGLKPDKHIFVDFTPDWDVVSDKLPQLTLKELYLSRHGKALPDDFEVKTHQDGMRTK
ncbi:MAG: hypothetical protein GKR90_17815 [Pseudomonadales bacterium]|nr:hypothetical protein [Pseudomonadales bacterium]